MELIDVNLSGLVIGQDLATALLGALNAGYFAGYCWQAVSTRARRAGATALLLLSIGAVSEAALSQGLLGSDAGLTSESWWALLRLPLFAGTLLVSAIIARRVWR